MDEEYNKIEEKNTKFEKDIKIENKEEINESDLPF